MASKKNATKAKVRIPASFSTALGQIPEQFVPRGETRVHASTIKSLHANGFVSVKENSKGTFVKTTAKGRKFREKQATLASAD